MASYFASSNKKGELFELQEDLNSPQYEKKKEAVKKVIAHMTIGKDVSQLFQSVIKCLEFPQLELKKLVYLYIINYSKQKSDDAIMVVSQFSRDVKNKQNPILRALAVRTMGCVRVPSINQYLAEFLKEALIDSEPYVRMTAVLCVPKVYEVSPDIIEAHSLIPTLQNMLNTEGNAKVLSNILIALNEMSYYRGKNLITITQKVLQKMLTAVNDCNEWGQIVVMDYLVNYIPENSKEAEMIVERVLPRLSLINPSVVFGGIKVILKFMDFITSVEIVKHLSSKLTQNLTSLISWHQPQIQYVVLKCVPHILQKRPGLMEKNISSFFCNVNEPFYIKNEKLQILAKICDNKNFEAVLNEIKEYVNEPDMDFVRRSITSLCTIALKFEKAVDKTIEILVEQMNQVKDTQRLNRQNEPYVQELIITMQKIYVKYPTKTRTHNSLEVVVGILDLASEEQSKAAAAWIIGEYAETIGNAVDLITTRINEFLQEQRGVQLEILTAAIKILLKYPDDGQHFIQNLLEQASYKTENPDVRDRAFIYWRMLSINTEKVRDTVIQSARSTQDDLVGEDSEFNDKMIDSLGLICSVYSKTVDEMFPRRRRPTTKEEPKSSSQTAVVAASSEKSPEKPKTEIKSQPTRTQEKTSTVAPTPLEQISAAPPKSTGLDLLDLLDDDQPTQPVVAVPVVQSQQQYQQPKPAFTGDLLDMLDDGPVSVPVPQNFNQVQSFSQPPVQQFMPQTQQQQPQMQAVSNSEEFDLFDSPSKSYGSQVSSINYINVVSSTTAGKAGRSGLQLDGAIVNEEGKIVLKLRITNKSTVLLNEFVLQISPNYFGLKVSFAPVVNVPANAIFETQAILDFVGQANLNVLPPTPFQIVFAVKCPIDVFFFNVPLNSTALLSANGQITQDEFKNTWKSIPDTNKRAMTISKLPQAYFNLETLQEKLRQNNIFFVASKNKNSFYSARLNNSVVLFEINAPTEGNPQEGQVSARGNDVNIIQPLVQGAFDLLKN